MVRWMGLKKSEIIVLSRNRVWRALIDTVGINNSADDALGEATTRRGASDNIGTSRDLAVLGAYGNDLFFVPATYNLIPSYLATGAVKVSLLPIKRGSSPILNSK